MITRAFVMMGLIACGSAGAMAPPPRGVPLVPDEAWVQPGGTGLLTARGPGPRRTFQIWRRSPLAPVATYEAEEATWRPDGAVVVLRAGQRVTWVDAASLATLGVVDLADRGAAWLAGFSEAGRLIVDTHERWVGKPAELLELDPRRGVVAVEPGPEIGFNIVARGAQLSGTRRYVAVQRYDDVIVWDRRDHRVVRVEPDASRFAWQGDVLAFARREGFVTLRDVPRAVDLRAVPLAIGNGLRFVEGGRRLFSPLRALVVDAGSGLPTRLPVDPAATLLAWGDNDTLVVVDHRAHELRLVDAKRGALAASAEIFGPLPNPLVVSPAREPPRAALSIAAAGFWKRARAADVWAAATERTLHVLHHGHIRRVRLAPLFPIDGRDDAGRNVAISADGRYALAATCSVTSHDETVLVDLVSMRVSRRPTEGCVVGFVNDELYTEDGVVRRVSDGRVVRRGASSSGEGLHLIDGEGTIVVRDARTGRRELELHDATLSSDAFSDDDARLVAREGEMLSVYEVATGQRLLSVPGSGALVYARALDADGASLLVYTEHGVRLYRVEDGRWIDLYAGKDAVRVADEHGLLPAAATQATLAAFHRGWTR